MGRLTKGKFKSKRNIQRLPPSDVTASLPTEVLLHIFKLISLHFIKLKSSRAASLSAGDTSVARKHVKWLKEFDEEKDMCNPKLFPYNLSNVCRRWYDVMQAYPEWWSRIRILVDHSAPARIPSDVRHLMELTQHVQPLQLFIANGNNEVDVNPEVERDLIGNVAEIIRPHMARFQSIVIQARHGSSLPLISSGVFSEPSPLLKELKLECTSYPVIQSLPKVDGRIVGYNTLPPSVKPSTTKSFESISLALGGPTFLDACTVPDFWRRLFLRSSYISLKVSHMKTDDSYDAYLFLNALCSRAKIDELILEDVDLLRNELSEELLQDELLGLRNLPSFLTLTSMEPTSLLPFFSDKFLSCLCVDNCPTTGVEYPKAIILYMDNIAEDQEISDTVICADPSELYITDCPGLDDFTLGALSHTNGGGVCHGLRQLHIKKGRTGITPRGLKRFIKGRRRISDNYYAKKGVTGVPSFMDDDDWEFPDSGNEPTPLQSFNVTNAGCELSNEDMKFFTDSICEFYWKP
ncbi:hypothetical protein BDQ17DRAFT_542064 [Cyathus striatus]|nr:hypothetical protein BDQ17DRAFT_542064 [Cyathus striatus]